MLDPQRRKAIDSAVAAAYNVFRGVADPREHITYVMAMLLLKYLSDCEQEGRSLADEPPSGMRSAAHGSRGFHDLCVATIRSGNGEPLDRALRSAEEANASLKGIFQDISFDAAMLGSPEQKERLLGQLLAIFESDDAFNFHDAPEGAPQAIAYAADTVLKHGAALVGKRGKEFFTPPEVSRLLVNLVQPKAGETVGDPCCGSGSLLIACSKFAHEKSGHSGCSLHGQEKDFHTWALARMNMVLHGETDFQLEWGDTLLAPKLLAAKNTLRKFDIVVSTPPFSLKEWGHDDAEHDVYNRYARGVPPRTSGDYAFISHMVETLNPATGRMATVVPLGVLFRSAAEQQIRRKLIQENLIEAVIALPGKIFPYTAIATAILVLRKNKADDKILFINAVDLFQHGKTQNFLRQADVDRITDTYLSRSEAVGYARVVSREEVAANDYSLNVAQYVQPIEGELTVDLKALQAERAQLKEELAALEAKLANLLKEVGHA